MNKNRYIILVIPFIVIVAIVATYFVVEDRDNGVASLSFPSAEEAGFIQPDIEGVQEVNDIDKFIEAYNFTVTNTPIKETILSSIELDDLKRYYQAIFDKNEVPIKDFKKETAIFETNEIEGIVTREMLKDISLFVTEKKESEIEKNDGYSFYGALWENEGESFGASFYWLFLQEKEDLEKEEALSRTAIPKPEAIYSFYDAEYAPYVLYYFVYDQVITSYIGGYEGVQDVPRDISTIFTTSLQADEVDQATIQYLQKYERIFKLDQLLRLER